MDFIFLENLVLPLHERSALAQLTGRDISVGQTRHQPGELADPAPPFLASGGKIQIYGTAPYFLQWDS